MMSGEVVVETHPLVAARNHPSLESRGTTTAFLSARRHARSSSRPTMSSRRRAAIGDEHSLGRVWCTICWRGLAPRARERRWKTMLWSDRPEHRTNEGRLASPLYNRLNSQYSCPLSYRRLVERKRTRSMTLQSRDISVEPR
jgi:hypothetical protein